MYVWYEIHPDLIQQKMLEQNGPITKSYLIKSHYGITYIYSQDGHKYVYNWVNKDDDHAAFKWPLRELF